MKRRHLLLILFALYLVFHMLGLYVTIMLKTQGLGLFIVGGISVLLSYKYAYLFHFIRLDLESSFEVIDPNEHISVDDAIERYKEAERIRLQNSKWYEFWSWS